MFLYKENYDYSGFIDQLKNSVFADIPIYGESTKEEMNEYMQNPIVVSRKRYSIEIPWQSYLTPEQREDQMQALKSYNFDKVLEYKQLRDKAAKIKFEMLRAVYGNNPNDFPEGTLTFVGEQKYIVNPISIAFIEGSNRGREAALKLHHIVRRGNSEINQYASNLFRLEQVEGEYICQLEYAGRLSEITKE